MGFSLTVAQIKSHTHSSAVGDGGNVLSQHYVYAPDSSQLLLVRDSGLTQGASVFTFGPEGRGYLVGNGYFDGVRWQRFNTAYKLWLLTLWPFDDAFSISRAPAGANPANPSEIFRIRSDGRIVLPVFHPIIALMGLV